MRACSAGLFSSVVIPPAVATELSQPATPELVRRFIASRPEWLHIQAPAESAPLSDLGTGESQAIRLAIEVSAAFLLIDDRVARREARRLGLTTVGTLGVIARAAERGLLTASEVIDRLPPDFRIDRDTLAQFRARFEPPR